MDKENAHRSVVSGQICVEPICSFVELGSMYRFGYVAQIKNTHTASRMPGMVLCRMSFSIGGSMSRVCSSISDLGLAVSCDFSDDMCSDTQVIHQRYTSKVCIVAMTYQTTEDGECRIYHDRRGLVRKLVT